MANPALPRRADKITSSLNSRHGPNWAQRGPFREADGYWRKYAGAKWGAIVYRRQAMLGLHERSRYASDLAFSYCEPHRATGGASMAWRGSGVRIPSAPLDTLSSTQVRGFPEAQTVHGVVDVALPVLQLDRARREQS
jgi:hypothetical protein